MAAESSANAESFPKVDLTEGKGLCFKQILKEGSGECPPKGSKVSVHYTGRLLDGTVFDSSRERDEEFSFTLGMGQVIKGWDTGVATMKIGERAILTCAAPYAYGSTGSPPKIPGGATLEFDVELFSWEEKEKEPWQMTFDEKMENALQKKEKANQLFKEGDFRRALAQYEKASTVIELDLSLTDEQKAKANEARLTLFLNQAMANIKLGNYGAAIKNCGKALEIDENNTKALFRRASANKLLCNYAEAKADLLAAIKVSPSAPELRSELAAIEAKEKETKAKEKAMFSKMFS